MKRRIIIGSIIIILIFSGVLLYYYFSGGKEHFTYKTTPIQRGDLLCTIGATGTVEPEELIDVGAQVAGRIVKFGKDKSGKQIDFGSKVEEGTVLANIDDVLFQSDVLEKEASLSQAKAYLQKAEADLVQYKSKYVLAASDYKRALTLHDVNARKDLDSYKSAYESAKANVDMGTAIINQTKAAVKMSESQLKRAKQNLDYCTISSPVKGVVIDRRVNIGQTVVSSLNAPSLFLIAKDLTRMEVWVTVNEADVGKISPGQNVTFTVDAYPGETFTGKVVKIRLNASVTQNVVTYVIVVSTDNSSGKLLPYLTANVKFETDAAKDVFMVANAALRWTPKAEMVENEYKQFLTQNEPKDEIKQQKESQSEKSDKTLDKKPEKKSGIIWVLKGDNIMPLEVTTGLSNDSVTEISSKDLKEGMSAVIGVQTKSKDNSAAGSPFMPKFGNRPGGGSGGGSSGTRMR